MELGKLGDVIVIDQDPLQCSLGELLETKVMYTVVGGKIVHERTE